MVVVVIIIVVVIIATTLLLIPVGTVEYSIVDSSTSTSSSSNNSNSSSSSDNAYPVKRVRVDRDSSSSSSCHNNMPGPATTTKGDNVKGDDDDDRYREYDYDAKPSSSSSSLSLSSSSLSSRYSYHADHKTIPRLGRSIKNLKVGDLIDVKDSVGIWSEAEVLKVDNDGSRIYITYLYWSNHFNEWIDDTDIDNRVAKINTHTYYEGGPFKAGQRIEALDQMNVWLEAFIIDVDDYRVKVHYKGWSSKFDEWHDSQNPSKLRRYGVNKSTSNIKETKLFKIPGVELVTMTGIGFDMKNDSSDIVTADYNRYKNDTDDDYDDAADSKSPAKYKNANIQNNRTRQIAESSDRYTQYIAALKYQNLRVVAISGDGNCLFRSVAHQVYGDEEFHDIVRQKCMDYMEAEAPFFSQFVEGGLQFFHLYIKAKRTSACWGDDPEIQAICELYHRPTEIWAYDSQKGAQKLKTFHETSIRGSSRPVIRLSYYGGGHYDSIVKERDHAINLLKSIPGEIEDSRVREVVESRRILEREARSINVDDVKRMSDLEETEREQVNAALQLSSFDRLGWADENIESCLLNYLQNAYDDKATTSLEKSSIDVEKATMRITDVDATQGEVLRLVTQQSELEYLDKAILSSLADGTKSEIKDDDSIILESMLTQNNDNDNDNDNDNNLNMARYPELSEDEALALALQQSVSSSNVDYDSNLEDQLLNAAIQESMKSTNNNNGYEYMDDEEMMINEAIRASYQYK